MGFKVLLLAAMGLGALYMMHILAQDYNKIRKPVAKLARFFLNKNKRNTDAITPSHDIKIDNFEVDWTRILKHDPLTCAQSLICQITAGAEIHNEEAIIMQTLIRYGIKIGAPQKIQNAYEFGTQSANHSEKCLKKYSTCPYTAKTMLKILAVYSYLFGS